VSAPARITNTAGLKRLYPARPGAASTIAHAQPKIVQRAGFAVSLRPDNQNVGLAPSGPPIRSIQNILEPNDTAMSFAVDLHLFAPPRTVSGCLTP
jgi:hypothetical protein